MKLPAWTFWMAVILAGAACPCLPVGMVPARQAVAADAPTRPARPAGQRPPGGPTSAPVGKRSLLEDAPFDAAGVPVTPPTTVKPFRLKKPLPLLPEGTPVVDRLAGIARDPTGKWWTIKDARVGRLYLLPCGLLEAIEGRRASPQTQFRLTGEVRRYRGAYYLMLRKAAIAAAPLEEKPTTLPTTTAPAPAKHASAEDVARELMREKLDTPILPLAPPTAAEIAAPSVPPPGRALRPGPGRMLVNRLARLVRPGQDGWSVLAFEADNTLREPPMRILPSRQLEKMEKLSRGGARPGARFGVSAEVHNYRGRNYVLLWPVFRKREMGQF